MPVSHVGANRRAAQARKRRERLKNAEDARAEEVSDECREVFDAADHDNSGTLEPHEARALIVKLTNDDNLSDGVYKQLVGYARDEFPGKPDVPIEKSHLPKLLSAARAYESQRSVVDALLVKHDTDRSGQLELREFITALHDVSPDGMKVRAGDVLWLLSKCDMDGDRELTFAELLPAIGLWRDIAGPLDALDDGDEEGEDGDATDMILEAVCEGLAEAAIEGEGEGSGEGEGADAAELPLVGLEAADKAFEAAAAQSSSKAKGGVRAEELTRYLIDTGHPPSKVHAIVTACEHTQQGIITRDALRRGWHKACPGGAGFEAPKPEPVLVVPMVMGFSLAPGITPMVSTRALPSAAENYEDGSRGRGRGKKKAANRRPGSMAREPTSPGLHPRGPQQRRGSVGGGGSASGNLNSSSTRHLVTGSIIGREVKVHPLGDVEEEEEPLTAESRAHRLEGARIVKKGLTKSYVRTMSQSCIIVDNSALKAAERAVATKHAKARDGKAAAAKAAAPSGGEAAVTAAPPKGNGGCCVVS